MKNFISSTTQSCYYQLRSNQLINSSTIRKNLTDNAIAKLVTSLILSRLDYCNALLSGLPAKSIHLFQRIQNNATRLVLKKPKSDHITPLLRSVHWLPVSKRIQYKIATLCYKCIHNSAPAYLSDCLQLDTPSRTLRSASDILTLRIPRIKLSTVGSRTFSSSAAVSWNTRPLSLREIPTLDTFKRNLKTHLLQQSAFTLTRTLSHCFLYRIVHNNNNNE